MTTTNEAESGLAAGTLTVAVHDGGRVIRWHCLSLVGLTGGGIAAALAATSEHLASLDSAGKVAMARHRAGVSVSCQEWRVPLIGDAQTIAATMAGVINGPGNVAQVA